MRGLHNLCKGEDSRNHFAKARDAIKSLVIATIVFLSVTGFVHLVTLSTGLRVQITNVNAVVSPLAGK